LYSSCSLEREENEDVLELALHGSAEFQAVNVREELQALRDRGELVWNDLDSLVNGNYFRTLPGIHPSDGFFGAILKRVDARAASD
jgi:16S rRNA (cytosine967-C5)-methyltransferase